MDWDKIAKAWGTNAFEALLLEELNTELSGMDLCDDQFWDDLDFDSLSDIKEEDNFITLKAGFTFTRQESTACADVFHSTAMSGYLDVTIDLEITELSCWEVHINALSDDGGGDYY